MEKQYNQIIEKVQVEWQKQIKSQVHFPTVYQPNQHSSYVMLQKQFLENKSLILQNINRTGAVIFRKFDIKNPNEAASIIIKLGLSPYLDEKNQDYIIGSGNNKSPKFQFLTNETNDLHNELIDREQYPQYVCLYCQSTSLDGESLSLFNNCELYSYAISKFPEFTKKLEEIGINYSGIKNSKVVRKLSHNEKVLLSQILKQDVELSNGQLLPCDFVEQLKNYYDKNRINLQWQAGDIIFLKPQVVSFSSSFQTCPFRKIYISHFKGTQETNSQLCLSLNSGDSMPLIGYGTWKINGDSCRNSVYLSIKNGYRLIDCASIYANEIQVGQAIHKAISEKIVKREQLFITSKLWNNCHRKEHVKLACLKTMKDLGVQYLDLFLIHFPISIKFVPFQESYPAFWISDSKSTINPVEEDLVSIAETWTAMEQLVNEGLVRNIGISNFQIALIRNLMYIAKIKPAVLQNEIHPFLTEKKLIRFCRENGIQMTSYSTLGAYSYLELNIATQEQVISTSSTVVQISKKHKKSVVQVVLRWALQQGLAVVPKSSKQSRICENYEVLNFVLTEEEMHLIDALNKNKRYNDTVQYMNLFMKGKFIPNFD